MWHAYNLIREGDTVTATTFRKVQKDSGGTSAVASERIKIKLTIKVEEVDFDAEGASPLIFIACRRWQCRLCCISIVLLKQAVNSMAVQSYIDTAAATW